VIGPNGAGKTTFMDIVTGKTRPDEGTVRLGRDGPFAAVGCPKARSRAPGIGRKFQRPTVFEDQSVRDNLLRGAEEDRAPLQRCCSTGSRPEDAARIEEICRGDRPGEQLTARPGS
jgi:urea transport system ATP-binding protein